jgi:hypothetical protein
VRAHRGLRRLDSLVEVEGIGGVYDLDRAGGRAGHLVAASRALVRDEGDCEQEDEGEAESEADRRGLVASHELACFSEDLAMMWSRGGNGMRWHNWRDNMKCMNCPPQLARISTVPEGLHVPTLVPLA